MVQRLKKGAGLQNSPVQVYPWARAYKMALERKNTFIFSIVRTPEREDKFIWVRALGNDAFGFYGKRPIEQYQIYQIADAKRWLTVVLRQDLVFETLTSLGFEERRHLIIASNLDSVFKLFFSGKADLVVTNKHLFKTKAELIGANMQQWGLIWTIPELTQGYYLAAHKDSDPMIIEKLKAVALADFAL